MTIFVSHYVGIFIIAFGVLVLIGFWIARIMPDFGGMSYRKHEAKTRKKVIEKELLECGFVKTRDKNAPFHFEGQQSDLLLDVEYLAVLDEGFISNAENLKTVTLRKHKGYPITITRGAFRDCPELLSVRIPVPPSTINSSDNAKIIIESGAFQNCPNLKEVVVGKNPKMVSPELFINCPNAQIS